MDKLHAVAQVLMQKEKISGDDFRALMEGKLDQEEDEDVTTPEPAVEPAPQETPVEETPAQEPPVQE